MLNKSSAVIGSNLADIFVGRGLKIVPKANTLLSELVRTSSRVKAFGNKNTDLYRIPDYLLQDTTGDYAVLPGDKNQTTYKSSSHDSIMDNYQADLSRLVSGHIAFARSVVNPKVKSFLESVEERLGNYKHRNAEDFFSISYYSLGGVYRSVLVDELSGYEGDNSHHFTSLSLRNTLTNDFNIIGYLMTGDEAIDRLLSEHLRVLGEGKIIQYLTESFSEYTMSTEVGLDYSLVNYLFYRNLSTKTDLNLGVGLIQLQTQSVNNRDYFGSRLISRLRQYENMMRVGVLLSAFSEMEFSVHRGQPLNIVIYQESFDKMVEEGLNLETLFGYIATVDSTPSITVTQLKEKAGEYASRWTAVRSVYTASMVNSRLDIFKSIVTQCFEASLNVEVTNEDEKNYLTSHSGYKQETLKKGYEYIDGIHIGDVDSLDRVALDLIAKIQYRFTNAYFILNEMKQLLETDDKITPMEASLMAAAKLVTDFLLENATVVKG